MLYNHFSRWGYFTFKFEFKLGKNKNETLKLGPNISTQFFFQVHPIVYDMFFFVCFFLISKKALHILFDGNLVCQHSDDPTVDQQGKHFSYSCTVTLKTLPPCLLGLLCALCFSRRAVQPEKQRNFCCKIFSVSHEEAKKKKKKKCLHVFLCAR